MLVLIYNGSSTVAADVSRDSNSILTSPSTCSGDQGDFKF